MRRAWTVAAALGFVGFMGCVELTYKGERVRVTTNPDVVRPCRFIANVKATSGWGGAAGTGLAGSNTEKTLQNKTADLGGDVVFVNQSGIHASGEAYSCENTPSAARMPAVVSPDFIHIATRVEETSGCLDVGPHIRVLLDSSAQVTLAASKDAREMVSRAGGDTLLILPIEKRLASGVGYRCGK